LANFQNAEFSKIGKHLSDKLVTFSAGHILIMRRRDSNDEDKTLSYFSSISSGGVTLQLH